MRRALAIATLALPASMPAQDAPGVSAVLEPQRIRIGEHATITLGTKTGGGAVAWPSIGDTLTARVEVIAISPVDTLDEDASDGLELVRRITITSFDSGFWAIPPFRLSLDGRPVETAPLLLQVDGFPVPEDTEPADIRPIVRLPFSLIWWARQHWTLTASAALMAMAIAALALLLKRKRMAAAQEAPEAPPQPLHQRMLEQLDALERERLWQQGQHKAYQSRLTDLLRGYIEEHYQVPALERTTDELMQELRVSALTAEQRTLLGNMLRSADLVKFAKAIPTPQENEQLMASARRFILESAQQATP